MIAFSTLVDWSEAAMKGVAGVGLSVKPWAILSLAVYSFKLFIISSGVVQSLIVVDSVLDAYILAVVTTSVSVFPIRSAYSFNFSTYCIREGKSFLLNCFQATSHSIAVFPNGWNSWVNSCSNFSKALIVTGTVIWVF
jgi:hypothetical protein